MKSNVYKQNKDIIFRQEGDEAILFNPENSDVAVVNPTGCFIWALCDGAHTEDAIIHKLLEAYDTKPEKAKEDLTRFLKDLEKRDFIKGYHESTA